ncbi:MAG TPA: FAD-binding oxidoreductase [Gemmatimonadaceae bacterium]
MTHVAGTLNASAAGAVIDASTTEQVQEAVRDAAARADALRVVGAGTWLHAGRPVRAASSLCVRSLAGVVEYVPGDLTITAWAGTSLEELDRVTAEHGQWLALDPFGVRESTLGATVATGSFGPLAASFGTPRDVVLGLQCVTGDGEIVHGGARVVKHVAGYDLVRLMTGAWGTLGVLTMLTLRLRARAPVDATYAVTVAAPLREWIALYRAASISPLATELLDGATAAALGAGSGMTALVRVSGNDEAVAAQEKALAELGSVRSVSRDTWAALARRDPSRPLAALRLSQRSARIADVWELATSIARDVPDAFVHATLERGIARVVLPHIGDTDLLGRLRQPSECARVFEVLPAALWREVAPSAVSDPLSQRVRAAFDPERRLNPGILGDA